MDDQTYELEKLDEEQVEKAQNIVKQKHPLDEIPLWKALPILKRLRHSFPSWIPRTQGYEDSSEDEDTATPRNTQPTAARSRRAQFAAVAASQSASKYDDMFERAPEANSETVEPSQADNDFKAAVASDSDSNEPDEKAQS